MSEKKEQKKSIITNEELEISEIFRKADSVKGEQLFIGSDNRFESNKEIENYVLKDIDNPEKKYDVYYKGVEKLLKEELPKGASFKEARDLIREEKIILLTGGKKKDSSGRRGADSRMSYVHDLDVALGIISNWIMERGTLFDLYTRFREENIKRGYHDSTSK
ncbi:MAG: hypothetical protein RLN90_01620 [Balneolaceae bacterium]